jgi:sugar phosphate isomerase/epimerase
VRLALSEISTVGATFAEDVAAYAAAGFDAIGIWEFKLPDDDEANLALLREHGLAVANCVPAIPAILQLGIPGMEGPADPKERINALCSSMRRLAAYEPESVACLTGPTGGRSLEEARGVVTEGLQVVAAAADTAGVTLAFEPIHRVQRESTSFVNSIEDAVALLHEAGLDHVSLLLDVYHVWDDPALWDLIARASYRIAGVHVSDWPYDPSRTDRELPGHGVGGTREIVDALALSGWDGSLDVEIFSEPDRFWSLPVDEAARQAFAATSALVA